MSPLVGLSGPCCITAQGRHNECARRWDAHFEAASASARAVLAASSFLTSSLACSAASARFWAASRAALVASSSRCSWAIAARKRSLSSAAFCSHEGCETVRPSVSQLWSFAHRSPPAQSTHTALHLQLFPTRHAQWHRARLQTLPFLLVFLLLFGLLFLHFVKKRLEALDLRNTQTRSFVD